MAIINKPDMTNLWASGGAIIAPSASKVQTGWTAEIPPHQWENWVQNRQDLALGYLFQRGLAEWDANTEYFADQSVVLHEGTIYIANTNNIGEEPSDVSSVWRTLFSDIPAASESQKGVVEIATTAEAQALIDDQRAITPKKLGDAMNAHVIGMGQTWQDVTGSRAFDTNYTNTTGRTIALCVTGGGSGSVAFRFEIVCNGVVAGGATRAIDSGEGAKTLTATAIVPPGAVYAAVTRAGGPFSITQWSELR